MGKKKAAQKNEVAAEAIPTATAEEGEELVTRNDLQDWFDRWTESIGSHLPGVFNNRLPEMWGASRELSGVIKIEETVSDEAITLRGEIPGIDPEHDIEIMVDGGRLSIKAERREARELKEGVSTRSEFHYGSYRRSFELPPGASIEDIDATYENGILDVRIPLDSAQPEPTRIAVSTR